MGLTRYEVMMASKLLTSVPGLSILTTDPYKPPTRTLGSFLLDRTDKRKINSSFITERHIPIQCAIQQNSRALLDASWDSLQVLLNDLEAQLIIPWAGSRRSFTATFNDYTIDEQAGGYIKFTLDFILSDNFGYDLSYTQLLYATSRTLYNYTDSFQVGGSAKWQVPIFKATLSALAGTGQRSVTVRNPDTNVGVTVSQVWTAGAVLTVDSQNKSVQVNGVEVDFTGTIPEWRSGKVGYVNYQDNFTSRTLTHFMYYFKRYS